MTQGSGKPFTARIRLWDILAAGAFVLLVFLSTWRTAGHLTVAGWDTGESQWALRDFVDVFYKPALCFREGQNPYDAPTFQKRFRTLVYFPPYPPALLVLFVPLTFLTVETASLLFYSGSLALIWIVARLALRLAGVEPTPARVFGFAAVLMVSRPFYYGLILGQPIFAIGAGFYVALLYARRRPWLATLGLALAMMKPTLGLPLVLLLLVRGRIRVVAVAGVLAVGVSLVALVPLVQAAGGVAEFVDSVRTLYAKWAEQGLVNPVSSTIRVDATALAGHSFQRVPTKAVEIELNLLILGMALFTARRLSRRDDPSAERLAAIIICLCTVLFHYHLVYDLVILALPAAAFAWGTFAPEGAGRSKLRWVLLAALAAAGANHFQFPSVVRLLGIKRWMLPFIESVNGAMVLLAFGLCCWLALAWTRSSQYGVRQ